MKSSEQSESLFSSYTFEVIQKLKEKHYQKPKDIYNSVEYEDFLKHVQQPFIKICQLLYQTIPNNLAAINFYVVKNYGFEQVTMESLLAPIQSNLKKYLDIFSLLFIKIEEKGITIGCSNKAGDFLAKKIADRHPMVLARIIAKEPFLFYLLFSEDNEHYYLLDKNAILNLSLEEIIQEFYTWLQEYIPLFLLAVSDDITPAIRQYLNSTNHEYPLSECAKETGFDETELERWIRTIERKKQAILYGSPGTGKTFIAEKLAQHLIGGYGFKELVQFHPAYSYEDFIQGIRPQSEDGKLTYPLVPGRFLEFCKKAESFQDTCVLIIDEINRANLAQVFGELMYLLEYRDKEIPLAGGNSFRIPKNVRIIGTMNTADRSIAEFDYALRRRFAFIELRPNYNVLRRYHLKTGFAVEELIKILQQVNQAIADKNYEIGISFFLTDNLREDIEDIWRMEIEPYLEEYFFNQLEKVEEFRWEKLKQQICL